jgi:hypothetical protein
VTSSTLTRSLVAKMAALCLTVLAAPASWSHGITNGWDAAWHFSADNNPNGPWSYGWTETLGGGFNLFTDNTQTFHGARTWSQGEPKFPLVYYGTDPSPVSFNHGWGTIWYGHLGFHPGENGEFSVIRWTAPETGSFDLDGSFIRNDYGTQDVHVFVNGTSLLTSILDDDSEFTDTCFFFSSLLTLNAGDVVDFIVGYGPDQDFRGDAVDFTATIVPQVVPAPAGVWLLGTALVAVAARRRLKK